MKQPKNAAEVRCFCGLMSYYRNYIKNLAEILAPLYDLTKRDRDFKWEEIHDKAFLEAKNQISKLTVLTHYDPTLPVILATDASTLGIGAVLSHVMQNGEERPIAFASRVLQPAEKNYSTIEKEALAIVWGIKKFNQYLEGKKFTIFTDHRPLMYIFDPKKGIPVSAAARLQRWGILLSGFIYDIKYRKSSDNENADALSRLPSPSPNLENMNMLHIFNLKHLSSTISYENVKNATLMDETLCTVRQYYLNDWKNYVKKDSIHQYYLRRKFISLIGECLYFMDRMIIPERYRTSILNKLHENHLGIDKTKSLARLSIWWPSIDNHIKNLIDNCPKCLLEKRKAPTTLPIKVGLKHLNQWSECTKIF